MKVPRRSAASFNVVPIAPKPALQRPKPLAGMSPAERKEWRRVVDSLPADRFPASCLPVLRSWCEATVTIAALSAEIAQRTAAGESLASKPVRDLLRARALESGRQVTAGRQLRLSPQQQYTPATAARREAQGAAAPSGRKLWEG